MRSKHSKNFLRVDGLDGLRATIRDRLEGLTSSGDRRLRGDSGTISLEESLGDLGEEGFESAWSSWFVSRTRLTRLAASRILLSLDCGGVSASVAGRSDVFLRDTGSAAGLTFCPSRLVLGLGGIGSRAGSGTLGISLPSALKAATRSRCDLLLVCINVSTRRHEAVSDSRNAASRTKEP